MSFQPYYMYVYTLSGKTKNGAKTADRRFFPYLLENTFSSLLTENILNWQGFYQYG